MASHFIVQLMCTVFAGNKESFEGVGGWGSLGQREPLTQHSIVPWDSSWQGLTLSEVSCELKHDEKLKRLTE